MSNASSLAYSSSFRSSRSSWAAWWLSLAATGCVVDPAEVIEHYGEHHDHQEPEPPAPPHTSEWAYEGAEGPDHWSELDESYGACGSTGGQTPVDFPATSTPGLQHAVLTDYHVSDLTVTNDGHTIQVPYQPGSHLTLDDTDYQLVQFHFHSHSEHTVAGQSYPLELHFVHKDAAGNIAVLGVFVTQGAFNHALAPVLEHLPLSAGEPVAITGAHIDAAQLLPQHAWAWRYAGSLTTPPCTTGVQWTVFQEPITASAEQIAAFNAIYHDNFRPTQPLGDRLISGAHYEYAGDSGPDHWAEQASSWELCQLGHEQSPIDIPSSIAPHDYDALDIDYHAAPLTLANNGHTVQVDYAPGSGITIAGTQYALAQFHFHAHSEHTIDGRSTPLELHLVHKTESGELAVIGVLIEEGAANAALEPVFANLPASVGKPQTVRDVTIDAAGFLPEDLALWHYDGSLTTPPCSEHVKWHVLATPVTASAAQIAKFTALYAEDARPVQPLGVRTVL